MRLAAADRKQLPDYCGVYLIIDSDCVLYVGATGNLRNRLKSHAVVAANPRCDIAWVRLANREDAYAVESMLIKHLRPARNRKGVGPKPKPPWRRVIVAAPQRKNAAARISVADLQKELGLTREGTYKRLRAAGVEIISESFGPGTKGFIKRSDLKKVSGPRKSWKVAGQINAAKQS